jgi:hypothetical protein
MRTRTPNLILGLTAAAVLAAGCAAPGGQTDGWAGAPTAELAPTGMLLTGSTDASDMGWGVATDGTGAVWTRGPWRLTRVDPATSTATTWDAADDLAFASGWDLVGSSRAGVWIKDQNRVRLFDGTRFTADLTVPAELLHFFDGPGAYGGLRDVVEVGPGALWVTLEGSVPSSGDDQPAPPVAGRVVRYADGQWSTVSDFEAQAPGTIVVDAHGVPWVALRASEGSPQADSAAGVKRWDGAAWVAPAADDPDYPKGSVHMIAAAPDGGVYVLKPGPEQTTLVRFDGTSWSTVAVDKRDHIGEAMGGDALAADATGAWIASSSGVSHVTPDGVWQDYGTEQGIDIPWGTMASVAVSGERVAARTASGVHTLSGGEFQPVWADDAATLRTVGGLLAVSADEAWALAQRPGEPVAVPGAPEGVTRVPQGWARYRNGSWTPVGGDVGQGCPAALASDGAIWMTTSEGLVRWADGRAAVVVENLEECSVVAGPSGSVWVTDGGDVVQVRADGSRTSIGRPKGADRAYLQAAGPDGTVWVQTECDGPPIPALARWDGQSWQGVDVPDPSVWLMGMAVTDDGAAWAGFIGEDPQDPNSGIARYADGSWTTFPGWPYGVMAAPGGRACSMDDPDDGTALNCYGPQGRVATVHVPQSAVNLGIAPDGTIWISGGQVARMSEPLPAGSRPPG